VTSSATRYGKAEFLPREQREGTALCLSGGGYRAALFHLGALRRLNELGVLAQVDTLTSVSGGSIFAAQLATHLVRQPDAWPVDGGAVSGWEDGVARPMRAFTQRNIRTGAALSGFHPLRLFDRNAAIDALAARYAEGPAPGRLDELPERPRFVICASDMRFREQWVFDSAGRIGSAAAGSFSPTAEWTLARAVAASSCVPGPFRAMRVRDGVERLRGGTYAGPNRERLVRSIDLADGGVYDNLGIEPVWRDHAVVLVSDAAPSLSVDPPLRPVWSALRYAVTLLEQATEVRKRWLLANFIRGDMTGAYWSVASKPSHFELDPALPGYSDDFVERFISQVRIDLDVFSEGEIAVLENHGYLIAETAIRRHAPELAAKPPPLAIPHPDWMDEERAAAALADSSRTRFFSRRLRI
jgi:NTE family protein